MSIDLSDNGTAFSTFAKLDSRAAVGAATTQSGFFGVSADIRFMVKGFKSSALFVITEVRPFGMLMHDENSNAPFIASYERMSKAPEQDMTATPILLMNQMSDARAESVSTIGARSHSTDRLFSFF